VLPSLHQSVKQLPVVEGGCRTAAVQQSIVVEALECEGELVAKGAAEHGNGQQEARMRMIQRWWSRKNLPPGTTPWTWGWSRTLEPQLFRMERKPISAARRWYRMVAALEFFQHDPV
jgi:hypothetical protein